MTYLLDTHAFLWLAAEPAQFSSAVREIVEQGANELLLSAAIQALEITPLLIGLNTAMAAATLPLIHRDPFDRLLVAEAMRNGLTILSKDRTIPAMGSLLSGDPSLTRCAPM